MRIRWILLITLLSLALAGCGPSQAEAGPSPDLPSSNLDEIPSEVPATELPENPLQFDSTPESAEMPSNPPPVEKYVSLSKKDLADRLQIEVNGIVLLKTAEIVWPNAALGCPAPGKFYAQGKVPGYQVWLEAAGVEYIYNTDLSGQVILCPQYDPDNLDSAVPGTPGPTQQIGVPID